METPAWSERFAWLGYESLNFVDSMGSILVFGLLNLILIVFSAIFRLLQPKLCIDKWQGKFMVTTQMHNMLIFIHGTFFEIMVSFSITVLLVEKYDWLWGPDRASLYVGMFFAMTLLAYLGLVVYFTFAKATLIVQVTRGEQAEKT